jgi:hypothetical protein
MKKSKMTQVSISICLMTMLITACSAPASTSAINADKAVEIAEKSNQEKTSKLLTLTLSLSELSSLQVTNRYDVYNDSTEKIETHYGFTGSISSTKILEAFEENLNGISLSSIDEETYFGLEEVMDKNYHFDMSRVNSEASFIEFYNLGTLVYWDGEGYYMSDENHEDALSKVITLLKPVNFDS